MTRKRSVVRRAAALICLTAVVWSSGHVGAARAQVAPPLKLDPSNAETPSTAGDETPEKETLPSGPLPWKQGAPTSETSAPPQSAREMLKDLGIDDAALAVFHDRQPADEAEQDVLYRVLYRLTQMRREMIAGWTAPKTDWQALLDQPAEHRVQFFPLTGHVTQVEPFDIPAEKAELYDVPPLWRLTLVCDGAPGPVRLLTFNLPASWRTAESLDEPVEASGLFLKIAAGDEPELVFAANRFAWHPTAVNKDLGVSEDDVYLASLGLDMAEFAEVRDRTSALPRDPFYQLLAAVGMAEPAELARRSKPFSIVPLLKEPDQQRGNVIDITGQAQQVTKILVADPEIQAKYGIDHYYEIDMFVPLGTTLQLTDPNDKNKQLTYHKYPVTVCVRDLPEGLAEPDKPNVFETVHTQITLPAVFFKVWAVSTERVRKLGGDRKQFNPVFIGVKPVIIEREPFPAGTVGGIVVGVFILALGLAWLGVWRSQRGDRKFELQTLNKQFEVKPGESLNDLGIDASGDPDFSGLDQHDTHGKTPPEEAK